jgi:hypothetical protein
MRLSRIAIVLAASGMTALGSIGAAHALTTTSFDLVPTNITCLPDASGQVTMLHKEDKLGVDTLRLEVRGLPSNTDFSVFLTSADAFAAPPFGSTSYIGTVTTNAAGIGSLKVDAAIAEAFVSDRQGNPAARVRADLDKVVLWFADPAQVPACFNFSGSTPFDGDGQAGPAVLSSQGTTGLEIFPQ